MISLTKSHTKTKKCERAAKREALGECRAFCIKNYQKYPDACGVPNSAMGLDATVAPLGLAKSLFLTPTGSQVCVSIKIDRGSVKDDLVKPRSIAQMKRMIDLEKCRTIYETAVAEC